MYCLSTTLKGNGFYLDLGSPSAPCSGLRSRNKSILSKKVFHHSLSPSRNAICLYLSKSFQDIFTFHQKLVTLEASYLLGY